MELRHLLAVEAVLATGSFTAAAAARHISQPALWAQIKELEAELGISLFLRAGRGVAPTAACVALRPRLEVALGDIGELRRAAAEIREGWGAPARIGCAPAHVASFLAGCIRELTLRDPRTPFPVIVPVTTGSAIETLARGGIDLLVEPRARPAGPDSAKLYEVHTVAVGAEITTRSLDLRALDRKPVATMPGDSLLRRALDEAAGRAGVTLRVVHESRDVRALLALAEARLCVAIVHDEMLTPAEQAHAARVLAGGKPLSTRLWLAWRPEESLAPAARALRDVMRKRARERGLDAARKPPKGGARTGA